MNVQIKLIQLWCEALGADTADVDLTNEEIVEEITAYEIDSVGAIKFVVAVEEEFGVEISDELLILEDNTLFGAVCDFLLDRYENG